MPTATLSFSLPEEQSQHLCAVHSVRLFSALHDVNERLRQLLKHDGIAQYTSKRLAEEIMAMIADDLSLVEG